MVRYEFSLCIGRANTDSGITVKCHDDGISFRIKLMVCRQVSKWRSKEEAFAIPEGSKAILKIKKPDNTKCLIGGTVKAAGVLFKSPPEAFTVAGVSEAEVSIYGADGRRATTATFNIDVPEECVCNCDVESEPYIDIIGEQIKAAKEAEEGAKVAANVAMQAQINGPKIGDNGNWFVWDFEATKYVDTGVHAKGQGEVYIGADEIPKGYKLRLIGNENHNRSFINLTGIIGSPVVGSVDGNVINLSGNLLKGTYEVKFMLADGTAADIGTIEVV